MDQVKGKLNRRNFLLALGAGGAATVAAAVVAKNPPQPGSSAEGRTKRSTKGYTASEHVNNYYRTTKV